MTSTETAIAVEIVEEQIKNARATLAAHAAECGSCKSTYGRCEIGYVYRVNVADRTHDLYLLRNPRGPWKRPPIAGETLIGERQLGAVKHPVNGTWHGVRFTVEHDFHVRIVQATGPVDKITLPAQPYLRNQRYGELIDAMTIADSYAAGEELDHLLDREPTAADLAAARAHNAGDQASVTSESGPRGAWADA